MKITVLLIAAAASLAPAGDPTVADFSWPLASRSDARETIEAAARTASADSMSIKDVGGYVQAKLRGAARPAVERIKDETLVALCARAIATQSKAVGTPGVAVKDGAGKRLLSVAFAKGDDVEARLDRLFEGPEAIAWVPLAAKGWRLKKARARVLSVEDGAFLPLGQKVSPGEPIVWSVPVVEGVAYFPWALVGDDSSVLCVEAERGGEIRYLVAKTSIGGAAGSVLVAETPPDWWPSLVAQK